MKPRDIFKLAVRILGLIFLYRGLFLVPNLLEGIFGNRANPFEFFLMVGWPLAVACLLLRLAPQITEMFYPKSEE